MIKANDLDPDYSFISAYSKKHGLSREQVADWIILKTVLYDTESELRKMLHAEQIPNLRFGAERQKHKNVASSMYSLAKQYINQNFGSSLKFLENLEGDGARAMKEVGKMKYYGPWASWKVCDLASCVLGIDIDFSTIDFQKTYEYPLKGVLVVNGYDEHDTAMLKDPNVFKFMLEEVFRQLEPIMGENSPHSQTKRPMNMQEVETLLCKYHAHQKGKYPIGHDISRLRNNISTSPYEDIKEMANLV